MKRLRQLPKLLPVLLLAACAASGVAPNRRLLLAYEGPLPAASAAAKPQLVVRGIQVPDYLERRSLVYRAGGNELREYAGAEWAERPTKGITRWVAQALAAQRSDYLVQSLTTGDRLPDALLAITLDAAEPGTDGVLRLRGSYTLILNAAKGSNSSSGRFDADAPLAGNSAEASVAALQAALATATKNMAAALPGIPPLANAKLP